MSRKKQEITPERREELTNKYARLAHALQSGVAVDQANGSKDGEPKHLRVGINLSKTDMCGLVKLLIEKGVITEEEYLVAICDSAEAEVRRYEADLSARTGGASITLL